MTCAKCTLFVAVALLNWLINRRHRGVAALAGIRSMVTTQSNDLALGVPIMKALYAGTHPEFINYQFLLPVISLVVLNPAGTCGRLCIMRPRTAPRPASALL